MPAASAVFARREGPTLDEARSEVAKSQAVERGPLFREVRELLYRKFKNDKASAAFEEGESAIIEVTPVRLVNWWFT